MSLHAAQLGIRASQRCKGDEVLWGQRKEPWVPQGLALAAGADGELNSMKSPKGYHCIIHDQVPPPGPRGSDNSFGGSPGPEKGAAAG